MPVLYPTDLRDRQAHRVRAERQRRRRQIRRRVMSGFVAVVLVLATVGTIAYTRPIAAVSPSQVAIQQSAVAPIDLPWPAQGQAAVGAVGFGVLDEQGAETAKPIASTAKMVTALVVLEAKPLGPSQQGPSIPFTAQDEAIYHDYISRGGSVYPVTAGESITQRQALNALLVMSANNIADLLAVWAYGSMEAYNEAAEAYLRARDIDTMTIRDASGFSPQTKATASDLVRVGELLMQDKLLPGIVAQKSITIPGVGVAPSTNILLGDGIVGIKTGNTDEAGGCFVIALQHEVDGQKVTIVAAAMGADNVRAAMATAQRLALDARDGFAVQTLVAAGTKVGEYHVPWGDIVNVVAKEDLAAMVWLPKSPKVQVSIDDLPEDGSEGTTVGEIKADGKATPAVLASGATTVPFTWRLAGRYM